MSAFSQVAIIYNPNSTGDAPAIARKFEKKLKKHFPELKIAMYETERAGHAEELAYKAAASKNNPLIVSVSGDGGYHEVINGVMRAVDESKGQPICAVLPGGNANDHYSSINRQPLTKAIKNQSVQKMDLLAVTIDKQTRYAHSYAGLGLTPLVAIELNRHSLTALKEAWLAVKTFWKYQPFKIELDGKTVTFNSLVAANIDRMAKHLTLSEDSSPADGRFEVIAWPYSHKLLLVWALIKSLLGKNLSVKSCRSLKFKCIKAMPMQLDGEVINLRRGTVVTITAAHDKLRTIR